MVELRALAALLERGLTFNFQNPRGSWQPPVTPVPGNPTHSSGLHVQCLLMVGVHTYTLRWNTHHTCINKWILRKEALEKHWEMEIVSLAVMLCLGTETSSQVVLEVLHSYRIRRFELLVTCSQIPGCCVHVDSYMVSMYITFIVA